MEIKTFKKGDKVFFLDDNAQPICAIVINAADSSIIVVEEVISLITRKITSNNLFASREEAIEATL